MTTWIEELERLCTTPWEDHGDLPHFVEVVCQRLPRLLAAARLADEMLPSQGGLLTDDQWQALVAYRRAVKATPMPEDEGGGG